MGEKYQLMFLSDKDNKSILTNISNAMYKFDCLYNNLNFGKYSYWNDAPIWSFGNSKEVTENLISKSNKANQLMDVIERISQFYSQSIVFHKQLSNRITQVITSIIETKNLVWKEVSISFELNDLLANGNDIATINKDIKGFFIDISTNLKPYYGKSAIEMKGLVEDPKKLIIDESTLGDSNFFSIECFDLDKLKNITDKYETCDYDGIGRFIFTSKHLGKFG